MESKRQHDKKKGGAFFPQRDGVAQKIQDKNSTQNR